MAFQANAFQNDAFLISAAVTVSPVAGIPLAYEEWARRKRKQEEDEPEPKPEVITGVVERIGTAPPKMEVKVFRPSPPIETGLSELTKSEIRRRARLAKRRRQEEEWLLLN